jgi:hypothetical protein
LGTLVLALALTLVACESPVTVTNWGDVQNTKAPSFKTQPSQSYDASGGILFVFDITPASKRVLSDVVGKLEGNDVYFTINPSNLTFDPNTDTYNYSISTNYLSLPSWVVTGSTRNLQIGLEYYSGSVTKYVWSSVKFPVTK